MFAEQPPSVDPAIAVPYKIRYQADFEGTQNELIQTLFDCLENLGATLIDETEPVRLNPIENRYELAAILNEDFEFSFLAYWSMDEQTPIRVIFDLDSPIPIEIPVDDQFFSPARAYFPELRLIFNYLNRSRVTTQKTQTQSDWAENRRWLAQHRHQYRGRWVALQDGQLVTDAASVQELIQTLDSTENLLITAVY